MAASIKHWEILRRLVLLELLDSSRVAPTREVPTAHMTHACSEDSLARGCCSWQNASRKLRMLIRPHMFPSLGVSLVHRDAACPSTEPELLHLSVFSVGNNGLPLHSRGRVAYRERAAVCGDCVVYLFCYLHSLCPPCRPLRCPSRRLAGTRAHSRVSA